MNKQAAIIGASGYAGAELMRYLAAHPGLDVAWVTANRNAGRPVSDLYGHLSGHTGSQLVFQPTDPDAVPDVDVAFIALPHGVAAEIGRSLAARGLKVVDLGPDWRLNDGAAYDEWYGWTHRYPDEVSSWVFGLTELHREEIAGSTKTANPGCYSTAAILALAPVVRSGAIATDGIIVDAASGISGAGRKLSDRYLFSELEASYSAYGVGKHRHVPEMEQELSVQLTFTPHLVPMARGLLVTCYAQLAGTIDDVRESLETAYNGEPFVRVLPSGSQPSTKQVSASNNALLGVGADLRTNTAVITCAVDNLGKGAAGQAIQNANLMLGLDETTGLYAPGVYP
jgi:N-acetyl-gamma-glutamyl-phosphate reductase